LRAIDREKQKDPPAKTEMSGKKVELQIVFKPQNEIDYGKKIKIKASLSDKTRNADMIFYYKLKKQDSYQGKEMKLGLRKNFTYVIEKKDIKGDRVFYYLKATTQDGQNVYSGNEKTPHIMKIKAKTKRDIDIPIFQ